VPSSHTAPQRFRGTIGGSEQGRVFLVVPFDADRVWGAKERHHVAGTINGRGIRGALTKTGKGFVLPLGPAWRRDCGLAPGQEVAAVLAAEGPQRQALAPDVARALQAAPKAAEFFDALASFYRKGYLRWIDATKRRPDVRAARIAEMVELLRAGRKQR
jgi:bacteriocin resistance YdeI/OmpD-like protein/uncharacterized protein DUF1905